MDLTDNGALIAAAAIGALIGAVGTVSRSLWGGRAGSPGSVSSLLTAASGYANSLQTRIDHLEERLERLEAELKIQDKELVEYRNRFGYIRRAYDAPDEGERNEA